MCNTYIYISIYLCVRVHLNMHSCIYNHVSMAYLRRTGG